MKKAMIVMLAAMLTFAAPSFLTTAHAQPAAASATQGAPVRGQTVYSSTGRELGRVTRVLDDGSVRIRLIAFQDRVATLPADTLSVDGDQLVTSLSLNQVVNGSRTG